jgi:AcrR family transcriptional regulator
LRGSRRPPSKGDRRELEILEVLEDLLAVKSFHALTAGNIAERAGPSRASMDFSFSSQQKR